MLVPLIKFLIFFLTSNPLLFLLHNIQQKDTLINGLNWKPRHLLTEDTSDTSLHREDKEYLTWYVIDSAMEFENPYYTEDGVEVVFISDDQEMSCQLSSNCELQLKRETATSKCDTICQDDLFKIFMISLLLTIAACQIIEEYDINKPGVSLQSQSDNISNKHNLVQLDTVKDIDYFSDNLMITLTGQPDCVIC